MKKSRHGESRARAGVDCAAGPESSGSAQPQGPRLSDIHVHSFTRLLTPDESRRRVPVQGEETVLRAREEIRAILQGRDERLLVIVGPCSIHELPGALEYAERLRRLAPRVPALCLVMRAYFEKPRTTTGWKGLINDPHLDGTYDINEGLLRARTLLVELAKNGVAAATEALDPVTIQYYDELISYASVGARTVESQVHREMASGLSAPVGFKNNTQGDILAAVNAVQAAGEPHAFIGVNSGGENCVVRTLGNRHCHIILRGGSKPNFDQDSVRRAADLLAERSLLQAAIIDCSHANSGKDYRRQGDVFKGVLNRVLEARQASRKESVSGDPEAGGQAIKGIMLESNLREGRQEIGPQMVVGISVTDACIGWEETEKLLLDAQALLDPGAPGS